MTGVAVACKLCNATIDTDTGGLIRILSAACGVVRMKSPFGRVSKYGVYTLSESLDHVDSIIRTVRDNTVLLAAIAVYDKFDRDEVHQYQEDFSHGPSLIWIKTIVLQRLLGKVDLQRVNSLLCALRQN